MGIAGTLGRLALSVVWCMVMAEPSRSEMRTLSIAEALKLAEGRNPGYSKANLKYESARLTYLKTMHGLGWVESFKTKLDYKRDESGDFKENIYQDNSTTEQYTFRRSRSYTSDLSWNFKRSYSSGMQADVYSKFAGSQTGNRYRSVGPVESLTDRSQYRYNTEKVNPEVGVNLTMPLMGKDKNSQTSQRKLAESTWQQAELDFDQAWRDLALSVKQGYYDVVKARETTRLRKKVLVEAEERLDVTKKRMGVGMATEFDVAQTELALLRNRADLADAVFSEKQAFSRFNSLIGLPLDETYTLGDAMPEPPASEPALKEIQTQAVSASTNLKRLDQDVEQASIKVGDAKKKLEPTLALTSNLAIEGERRSLPRSFKNPEEKYAFGFTYEFPFGDKTVEKVDVELAEATLGEKVIQRDELNQSLILDATETVQEIMKLQQRLAIARQSSEVARRSLNIAQAKYNEGRAEITDVIQARQSLVNAELEELNTTYSLAVSAAKLDKLTGRKS